MSHLIIFFRFTDQSSARIVAINEWALYSIEGAVAKDSAAGGGIARWRPTADIAVLESFAEVMFVQSTEIEDLVVKCTNILGQLGGLQEALKTINGIIIRENKSFTADEEKLLSKLWSKLGGNIGDKKMFKENLLLLEGLANYHETASKQVQEALVVLRKMRHQSKEVQKNLAAPAIAGSKIPPQVHMRSIQSAMGRLQKSTLTAKDDAKRVIQSISQR